VFNLGSKTYFLAVPITAIATLMYAFNTSDVGGFVLLVMLTVALAGLGGLTIAATGTADRFTFAGYQDARISSGSAPSVSPILGGLGLALLGLGAALGLASYVGGLVALAIALVVWFSSNWREHPNHVAAVNTRVSDRFSLPFGMPLVVVALIATTAISISRILLAVSKTASWIITLILAIAIFAIGFVLAARPKISRRGYTVIAAVAVVAVAAMAIVGIAMGERNFEHHSEHEAEHAVSVFR
jgi:hypothetical protein